MDTADLVAAVISTAALVASIISLVWQFNRSRWERPVVVVSGEVRIADRPTLLAFPDTDPVRADPGWVFSLTVTNVGERAVTVTTCNWTTLAPKDLKRKPPENPSLPLRLEPHDSRTWSFRSPWRADIVGTSVEPFVMTVQRPTWWEARRGVRAERRISGKAVAVPHLTLSSRRAVDEG